MKSPITLRFATTIYDGALRLSKRQALAGRRDEVLESFRLACISAADTQGAPGIVLRTFTEIWDLVVSTIAPERSAISEPGAEPPQRHAKKSLGLAVDALHALRALTARRADTALTVGLLTLGLATTGTIFAVADALILHPVPFPQPQQLAQLWSTMGGGKFQTPSVPRDLAVQWLNRSDIFSSGGAYTGTSALITSNGDPELVPAARISPGLLECLGVRPILGRTFSPEEGRAGTDHVVIISAEVWASRLGRSPDAIGRTLDINSSHFTVVGIMPDDFRFPYSKQRVWFPFDLRNPAPALANAYVNVVGRAQTGLSRPEFKDRIAAASTGIRKLAQRPWEMTAIGKFLDERTWIGSDVWRSILLLFAATVLLMLTVCANVANIGLSQAFSRTRDVAIRSALGASRWRIIRQTLIEQLLIGALAFAIALPLTALALTATTPFLPQSFTFSNLASIGLSMRLLVTMTALAFGAPLIAGLVPAIAGSRAAVVGSLKNETRSTTGSRGARWFRKGMVITEVACSVVLLVSASLLVRSFLRLQSVDTGFNTKNLISANVGFPVASFGSATARSLYVDQSLRSLAAMPGIRAVTAGSGVPPENGGITFGEIETDAHVKSKGEVFASVYEVRPDFFSVLDMPIVAGRSLQSTDDASSVVISQTLATTLFPGQEAIGRKFRWDDAKTWMEIVGVVAPVRESTGATLTMPQIYSPIPPPRDRAVVAGDSVGGYMRFAVRADDPAAAIPQIRAALKQINAGILVSETSLVDDQLAKDLAQPRFLVVLMLVFATAGLILAAAGLYAVLSCIVAEQLREYGIRLMLGASPTRVARTIVISGVATTTVGLVVGIGAAAALGKTISAILFKVEARDVTSYVVVSAVFMLAALAAAWRPARRACTVDPATLLRDQ